MYLGSHLGAPCNRTRTAGAFGVARRGRWLEGVIVNSDIELEISAGSRAGSYQARVIHAAAGGEPTGTVDLDVEEVLGRRGLLEATLLASAVGRRSVLPDEQPVREVGRQLFEALFTGPVYGMYRASLGVAQQRGERLRVVLRLTAPELAALPWEMLFDPETETYMCRQEPLVRHVPAPYTADPLRVRPPLRVLGLVASPRGLPSLDVDAEKGYLAKALAGPIAEGLIEVVWVAEATWHGVQDQLLAGQWHVLHFVGHGDYDSSTDEGVLALVGRDGRADLVEASRLADLLGEAQPTPRLVVLNSCSSGQAGVNDLFSGTAAALAHSGVSAVAAMQFTISDTAAIAFARGFYTAIAHGRGVDEAARSGRISVLGTPRSLEWVTPVLYVRGDTTHLFSGLTAHSDPHPAQSTPTVVRPQPNSPAMLRALYIEAKAKLRVEDYGTAVELLDELLTLDPGNAQVTELLTRAQHDRRLAGSYTDAQTAESTGDWARAISEYDRIMQADPAYRDVGGRLDHCKKQQEIADKHAELRYHYDAGSWQAVLDVAAELADLEPAAADPDELATAARQNLHQAGLEDPGKQASPGEKQGGQTISDPADEGASTDDGSSVAVSKPPRVKTTRIQLSPVDVAGLAQALCEWYESRHLEVTRAATSTGLIVQCRTREAWRRKVAMDAALTVFLRIEGEDLLIETGAGKWLGKGIGAGVGLLVAWPAILPAGFGAWRQYQLPRQTIEFLRKEAPNHIPSVQGTQFPQPAPRSMGVSSGRQPDQ
jgi:tetratricopeptide (TPR) repeat protein